jgi:hypothetical protein
VHQETGDPEADDEDDERANDPPHERGLVKILREVVAEERVDQVPHREEENHAEQYHGRDEQERASTVGRHRHLGDPSIETV